jgi:glutathione S-transferase
MAAADAVAAPAAAAVAPPIEVFVKAAVGHPDKLGDCPFSQRVLLTLEFKGVPYDAKYIDTSNKPQWFLDANPEGKVPVIKDGEKFVADSDVITQILEEKYPEPSLKTPEDKASIGGKIFPTFVAFLKSKDASDGTEEALVTELKTLDEHLKSNKPFIAGEKVTAVDLALAPKLYHMKIALPHYKKWSVPAELTNLISYIEAVHSLEIFKKTQAAEEFVIAGWSKFF